MHEIIHGTIGVLRAVLRFRWVALLTAFLVSTAGWLFVAKMDDYYEATARIFVDSNQILKPLLKDIAVQPDVNQRVRLMSLTLLGRPNLEKLADKTDLALRANGIDERNKLIDQLSETLLLKGTRGNSSIYTITYSNSDPALAKNMVGELIDLFIENSIGDEREDNEAAQEFFRNQAKEYEQRLAEADRRLSDFKRKNAGKMPSEAGTYYQRLEILKGDARGALLELGEAESRRASLLTQLSKEPRTISEATGLQPTANSTQSELDSKRRELATLLTRFTERHPRIGQLQSSITQLEKNANENNSVSSARQSFNTVANPAYQEIAKLLAETEARIAELEVRTKALDEQVSELTATVETIPKIEATYKQLDRDYGMVKLQYEAILSKREAARLSEQVEQKVDDVKFRVIDPAFVPSTPSGPPKALFSVAALLAGILSCVALAFFLSMLLPVFYDGASISKKTGYSILGTVAMQRNGSRTVREFLSWTVFFTAIIVFLASFSFVVAFHNDLLPPEITNAFGSSQLGQLIDQSGTYISVLVEKLTSNWR